MDITSFMLLVNNPLVSGVALLLGLFGVSMWSTVNALREQAKSIAMSEIPVVENNNPEMKGEEKMDLVLAAIWSRMAVPPILHLPLNFIFGKIVKQSAQFVFDTYFAEEFSKTKRL